MNVKQMLIKRERKKDFGSKINMKETSKEQEKNIKTVI
jgi:hypothetical protein